MPAPCPNCADGGWVLDWATCPVRFAVCPQCKNAAKAPKPYIVPHEVAPQGEDMWRRLHLGRMTAGRAHQVVTPSKLELAKGRFTLMYKLAAERLTRMTYDRDLTGNEFIEHGVEHEKHALFQYGKLYKIKTRRVSFVFGEDERTGCSPDSLNDADDRYGCEVKCPQIPHMIKLHERGPDAEFRVQILDQMIDARLDRVDLFCFHPDMRPYRHTWHRDQWKEKLEAVSGHIRQFNDELDGVEQRMIAQGFFTRFAQPASDVGKLIVKLENQITDTNTIGGLEAWEVAPETAQDLAILPIDQRERLLGIAGQKRAILALGTP